MVEGLGGQVKSIEAAFEPEAGAYGGHHHHGNSENGDTVNGASAKGGSAVIHEFGQERATENRG